MREGKESYEIEVPVPIGRVSGGERYPRVADAGGRDGFAVSAWYGARPDRDLLGGQRRSENDCSGQFLSRLCRRRSNRRRGKRIPQRRAQTVLPSLAAPAQGFRAH